MALILVCGFPASGKSTIVDSLESLLVANGKQVYVIRDGQDSIATETSPKSAERAGESTCIRSLLYKDSTEEKKTRARLRAATERFLHGDNIVVCDSLNYIKGFRYEMYCIAKASSVQYCVLYCDSTPAECVQRDMERNERGSDSYGEQLVEAIIQRFEEPCESNRWDSSLYKINVAENCWSIKVEAIRDMVLNKNNRLMPTMATRQPQNQGADTLGTLDRITRETESLIIRQLQNGKGQGDQIVVTEATTTVRLERKPKVSELRNMRRSYLNLARMHPPQGNSTPQLLDEYIEYLNAQLRVRNR